MFFDAVGEKLQTVHLLSALAVECYASVCLKGSAVHTAAMS